MSKLLQINTSVYGSTGKIATAIGQLALNDGWKSYIAYSRGKGLGNPSEMLKIGSVSDRIMHGLQTRLFDRHGLASKSATGNLIHRIAKIKPDIIHLHNIHGYYLNYEILFDYLSTIRTPVVWTLHDCWSFTGHCSYFMRKGCTKWQTGCHNCSSLKDYPTSFTDGSARNYIRKREAFTSIEDRLILVPVSEFIGNYLKYSFFRNCRCEVIRNGIDLSIFKPSSLNDNKEKIILAVANIWDERKGFEDIISLRELLPLEYKIIIVGKIKDNLIKLPKGIKHIPRTNNQEELAHLYSRAMILCNPTYEDSLPTVNIESIACGTPVISYRTGGCPETIDETTGFIIEQGDITGMAEIIRSFTANDKMASDCRKRAEQYFNQASCFNKYIDLYNSLL